MELRDAIKTLRIESGLSQRELAEKMYVERATIARWEAGAYYPNNQMAERLLRIIQTMNVSESCKKNIHNTLAEGRRRGKSAKKLGISEIDQELLCKIVDESANAVYAIEVETHKVLYINQRTEEWMDIKDDGSKSAKCYECLANSKTPCADCPLNNISEYKFTEHTVIRNGKYYKVRGRKMKWNGKDIYITYVSNVTDIMNKEKAKLQFFDLMPTGAGIYRVYFDGRLELVYMNEGFYRMLGIKREDCSIQPGFTQLKYIHPDDLEHLREFINNVKNDPDHIFDEEHRIDLGDGTYRKIILRGLITEKTSDYYTLNCSFITIETKEGK